MPCPASSPTPTDPASHPSHSTAKSSRLIHSWGEVGQDAITHIAGDEAVVAGDDVAAQGAIGMQQIAQLFGIELLAQRRRAHQVTEHHGELAAFATLRDSI